MKSWRRTIRALHRDIGYGVSALIIAYSISGIAVNHMAEWNPNYSITESKVEVGKLEGLSPDVMAKQVREKLSLDPEKVKGHFAESPEAFKVFLVGGGEVYVDPATGSGTMKEVIDRPLLREVNILHLNDIKGVWTWVADIFALLLIFLAISGMVMLKGKQGIAGRGKYFLGVGLAIPVAFIIYAMNGG